VKARFVATGYRRDAESFSHCVFWQLTELQGAFRAPYTFVLEAHNPQSAEGDPRRRTGDRRRRTFPPRRAWSLFRSEKLQRALSSVGDRPGGRSARRDRLFHVGADGLASGPGLLKEGVAVREVRSYREVTDGGRRTIPNPARLGRRNSLRLWLESDRIGSRRHRKRRPELKVPRSNRGGRAPNHRERRRSVWFRTLSTTRPIHAYPNAVVPEFLSLPSYPGRQEEFPDEFPPAVPAYESAPLRERPASSLSLSCADVPPLCGSGSRLSARRAGPRNAP